MTVNRLTKGLLWALLVLLLAGGAAWWKLRAPAATAVVLQAAPLVRTLQFSGRVANAARVDVGATITGRVAQVLVPEGQLVAAGQPLLQLEDSEWRAALAQALAGEQQVLARLAGLRSSGRSGAQAAVAQAESVLVAAQAELRRTQDLVARGFLSEAKLDETVRAVAVAQAQLAAARAQASANEDRGTDVTQAQAQLAVAQAATQAARARLAQTVVAAPNEGRVLTRAVEPGQIVQPGRALFTLALTGQLQLLAPVDERYLQQLQPGQAAQVRADAFPGQRFAAQVLSIAPLVDAQRGSVDVKFSVQEPPPYLREDMTLSLEVETAHRTSALVVPLAALRGSNTGSSTGSTTTVNSTSAGSADSVWLAQDGRVQTRPVRLGIRTLDAAEVLQGLAAGDMVLVGPAPAPGARVRADTSAAASSPGAATAKVSGAGPAMTNAMGR